MFKKLIFTLLALLNIGYASASCHELRENSEVTLSTAASSNGEICITLRDLHPSETYFMVDRHNPALVGYDASWQLTHGNTVYHKNIYTEDDIAKIELQGHDRATLRLKKNQNGDEYDYTFDIINNREVGLGMSMISVIVKATRRSRTAPITPPSGRCFHGEFLCVIPQREPTNPISSNLQSLSAVLVGNVLASSEPQCNDSNRPLTPAPYAKDGSGRQLNLNQILRQETAWRWQAKVISVLGNLQYIHVATFQRLYQNHKTGGKFDVKSSRSEWISDQEFGNYLYGAILHQHGFSLTEAQRYGAAYQAYQNNNHQLTMSAMQQGIRNFMTNTGDSEGDKEIIAKGFRYARDVHSQNPNASESVSCIDQRTLDRPLDIGGGDSGIGGEGSGGSGNIGGGTLMSRCELWYFLHGLGNGGFYMQRNCMFWMMP